MLNKDLHPWLWGMKKSVDIDEIGKGDLDKSKNNKKYKRAMLALGSAS